MEAQLFIGLILYTCLLITTTTTSSLSFRDGNQNDRLALLAIKAKITQDPMGTLSSWNHSLHFCEWKGITCHYRHLSRVSILKLQSQRLVGSISPYIGNLTFLTVLDLRNNSLDGEIPPQVGRLFWLKELVLSNNSLQGHIPINVSQCLNLINLRISYNNFFGRIPADLGSLSKLIRLSLNSNNLSGSIPSSLGNLSSLNYLNLRYNRLENSIPSDLGKLTSLMGIDLSYNNLSGVIPPSLYNLSLVRFFAVTLNQLQGNLPFDTGHTLPSLDFFSVGMNKFSGPIPVSFSNCSNLGKLELAGNYFVGSVSINFENLRNLSFLSLYNNNLGSTNETEDDLSFITSLTNCSNLEFLLLDNNNFRGMLPSSIANLSTKLTNLVLGKNQMYGSIPTGIQNLVGLTRLGMEDNMFAGNIPIGMGKLQNLRLLALDRNILSGQIPSSFGNLTELISLDLSNNQLSGRIPSSLGNRRYLQSLYLQGNKLNGTIPKQVIGLSSLSIVLNLGKNSLSGSLPSEVGNLKNLGALILSDNRLSGEIPSTLGECLSLVNLHMEDNLFQGNIPPSLSSLKGLEELSLSHNNLSGLIPEDFKNLFFLESLDLSFNNLEGEVPKDGVFKNSSRISVDGNRQLCGGIPELQLPDCPIRKLKHWRLFLSFKVIIPIVVGIIFLTLIVSYLMFYWRKKSTMKSYSSFNFGNTSLEMVSYNELLKATDGFSLSNLIGVGSFGSVYKAVLREDEKPVAVKVLKLQQRGATKSFMAECNALTKVRHRNLLKIITCCSSIDFHGNDFKALIFEYMPNGSLENWLYPSNAAEDQLPPRNLSFERRLNIVVDVASALDYLHHHCEMHVVHRDLKPSNILLDDDFTAHVGDFGLAKFLMTSLSNFGQNEQTNSTAAIKGSIGYVAPEYGMGSEVSTRGDVYSYGILLFEMFTGKRPTDDIFKDGLTLRNMSKTALLSNQILEIVDSRLLLQVGDDDEAINSVDNGRDTKRKKMLECLVSMFQIGVACSEEMPVDRMNMGDVVTNLHVVRDVFHGIGIHGAERVLSFEVEDVHLLALGTYKYDK